MIADAQSARRGLSARALLAEVRALSRWTSLGIRTSELSQTAIGPMPQDLAPDRWQALFGERTAAHQERVRAEYEARMDGGSVANC